MKFITCFVLVCLLSCTKEKGGSQLFFQWEKWRSQGISSYAFTYKVYCFCSPERAGPFQIVVLQGKISTVNGQPYDSGSALQLPTIDQLFEAVSQFENRRPYSKRINYNVDFGFPEDVYIDFDQNIADEETGFQVSQFYLLR